MEHAYQGSVLALGTSRCLDSFTSPRLLDGSTITVWLYDGNVDYLGVKHTFLFFMALVFAVGFVYTSLRTTGSACSLLTSMV